MLSKAVIRKPLLLFLTLITKNIGVDGSFDSFYKEAKFDISYAGTEISTESISEDIMDRKKSASQVSCGLSCLNKRGCVTALFTISEEKCVFLKKYMQSIERFGHSLVQEQNTKVIVINLRDPCSLSPCYRGRRCVDEEAGFKCLCNNNEGGDLCEIMMTGTSCNDIKQKYSSLNPRNGKYVISSSSGNETFTAYCDMEFDEGGWTQVARVVSKTTDKTQISVSKISSVGNFNIEQNYVLTSEFLRKFRIFNDFKQFRFECKSQITKRKIHLKTKRSVSSIVDFFVGAKGFRPVACGTFTLYEDDDSVISRNCKSWMDGMWGWSSADNQIRTIDHPMFIYGKYHWLLEFNTKRFECDNFIANLAVGDFWNVFLR